MKSHVQRLAILKAKDAISNQEIAELIGKSARYVQLIFSESDRDFTAEEIRRISFYLSDQGCNDLAQYFFSQNWRLQPDEPVSIDGHVDDEIADMIVALGRYREGWQNKNTDLADAMVQEAKNIANRMAAEINRIK